MGSLTRNLQVINARVGQVRRGQIDDRDYIVAPFTSIVPGVLNGSKGGLYYPVSEIAANPGVWNGIPLTIGHPADPLTNLPESARQPNVLNRVKLGEVYNDHVTPQGERAGEAWFDEKLVARKAPRIYKVLLNALEGRAVPKIEISTGLYTENIPVKNGRDPRTGREYDAIATDYRPDHLAILENQTGACSVADGCGVFNANPEGHNQYTGKGGTPDRSPAGEGGQPSRTGVQTDTASKYGGTKAHWAGPGDLEQGVRPADTSPWHTDQLSEGTGSRAFGEGVEDLESLAKGAADQGRHAEAAYQYGGLAHVYRFLGDNRGGGEAKAQDAEAKAAFHQRAQGGAAMTTQNGAWTKSYGVTNSYDDLQACEDDCEGDFTCISDCIDEVNNARTVANSRKKGIWQRAIEALGFVENANRQSRRAQRVTNVSSMQDRKDELQSLLRSRYGEDGDGFGLPANKNEKIEVKDLDGQYVYFCRDGKTFKLGYTPVGDRCVLDHGLPLEVKRVTKYIPTTNDDRPRHGATGQYMPTQGRVSSKQVSAAVKGGFGHVTGHEQPPATDPDADGDQNPGYGRADMTDGTAESEAQESTRLYGDKKPANNANSTQMVGPTPAGQNPPSTDSNTGGQIKGKSKSPGAFAPAGGVDNLGPAASTAAMGAMGIAGARYGGDDSGTSVPTPAGASASGTNPSGGTGSSGSPIHIGPAAPTGNDGGGGGGSCGGMGGGNQSSGIKITKNAYGPVRQIADAASHKAYAAQKEAQKQRDNIRQLPAPQLREVSDLHRAAAKAHREAAGAADQIQNPAVHERAAKKHDRRADSWGHLAGMNEWPKAPTGNVLADADEREVLSLGIALTTNADAWMEQGTDGLVAEIVADAMSTNEQHDGGPTKVTRQLEGKGATAANHLQPEGYDSVTGKKMSAPVGDMLKTGTEKKPTSVPADASGKAEPGKVPCAKCGNFDCKCDKNSKGKDDKDGKQVVNSKQGGPMLTDNDRRAAVGYLTTNCECWKNKAELLGNKTLIDDESLVKLVRNQQRAAQNALVVNAARNAGLTFNGIGEGQTARSFSGQDQGGRDRTKVDSSNVDAQFADGISVEGNGDMWKGQGAYMKTPDGVDGDTDDSLKQEVFVGDDLYKKKVPGETNNMAAVQAWLESSNAPVAVQNALMGALQAHARVENNEKAELIRFLTMNVRDENLRQRLVANHSRKPLGMLRDEAAALGYSGQPVQNRRPYSPPQPAPLPPPVFSGRVDSRVDNRGGDEPDILNAVPLFSAMHKKRIQDEDEEVGRKAV